MIIRKLEKKEPKLEKDQKELQRIANGLAKKEIEEYREKFFG
jgi:hypothetical protein